MELLTKTFRHRIAELVGEKSAVTRENGKCNVAVIKVDDVNDSVMLSDGDRLIYAVGCADEVRRGHVLALKDYIYTTYQRCRPRNDTGFNLCIEIKQSEILSTDAVSAEAHSSLPVISIASNTTLSTIEHRLFSRQKIAVTHAYQFNDDVPCTLRDCLPLSLEDESEVEMTGTQADETNQFIECSGSDADSVHDWTNDLLTQIPDSEMQESTSNQQYIDGLMTQMFDQSEKQVAEEEDPLYPLPPKKKFKKSNRLFKIIQKSNPPKKQKLPCRKSFLNELMFSVRSKDTKKSVIERFMRERSSVRYIAASCT